MNKGQILGIILLAGAVIYMMKNDENKASTNQWKHITNKVKGVNETSPLNPEDITEEKASDYADKKNGKSSHSFFLFYDYLYNISL